MIPLALLSSTALIQRQVVTPDAGAGATRTYATRATAACRVCPVSSSEAATFARADMVVTSKVFFGSDVQILPQDRLVIGGVAYLVASYHYTQTPDGATGLGTAFVSKRN